MKKIYLILLYTLFYVTVQGQINLSAEVDTARLSELRKEFQELYKQKSYRDAVEKGAQVSKLLIYGQNYKEATSVCLQMEQLIYETEKKTKKADFRLRFLVANERLRMYTREGRAEKSKYQLTQMEYCMNYLKDESLKGEMLITEAEYYHRFGMTNKSLDRYKKILQRCIAVNDEQGRESCYKDMLVYAKRNKMNELAKNVQTMYTAWQDSISMVRAANELATLQQEHGVLQQDLADKEKSISKNKTVVFGLWAFIIALTALLLILFFLLLKNLYQTKKLKYSLRIANESNVQKSEFISNINTQITPTLDVMEASVGKPSSDKIIQESIVSLKKKVTDMQTYISLEETREQSYPVSSIDVKQLCDTVMGKVSADFNADVESFISVPRVSVKTNAEALEQVLGYLLRRASANTESGKISLEFKKRNARTGQFIITDTGTCIDPERAESLFKPFVEATSDIKEDGWGLPICQLIAYKLNGTLKIDTEYKKGTRFILDLCS